MVSSQVVKVFVLFLVWCSMGLYGEIAGPTMIDIKIMFFASYQEVSDAVSMRGAGGFVGALVGGILVDKFEPYLDLLVGVAESIAAVAIFTIPMAPDVYKLGYSFFILGVCGGVINIAGIRAVITLWPEKTAVTLLLLHVGYGVGSLLVPVLVNPFLAVIQFPEAPSDDETRILDQFEVLEKTKVHLAFQAIGVGTMALSCVFYYFQFKPSRSAEYKSVQTETKTVKTGKTFLEMINPATYANGQTIYGSCTLILVFIYYFNMVGCQESFAHFVRSYSVDVFKFSKTQASYLNMTYWLSLTIGRLVCSVVLNYISIRRFFVIIIILHALSTTMLNMYTSCSASLLWVGVALQGFLVSPLYPTGIAYSNTLIEVTGMCLMVIQFAGSFGDTFYLKTLGNGYELYGPRYIMHAINLIGVVLLLIMIGFRICERFRKSKALDGPV